jgi:hypothetical protein
MKSQWFLEQKKFQEKLRGLAENLDLSGGYLNLY